MAVPISQIRGGGRLPDVTLPPFEKTVAEHGPTVLRVCRAVLGPVDAEDAWSETFLAALGAYPALRPDSNVRAWLVTIAHRKALDSYRASRRAPVPTDSLPERPSADEVGHRDDALWTALRRLPFKQRAAVAYRHLGDLSYAEIAELLGNNEAAARRNVADGLATLRTTYRKETTS
jgi:RNA polymerase sigma factor (sigma-70 family)